MLNAEREADLILQLAAVPLLLLLILLQLHCLLCGQDYLLLRFLVFLFLSLQKVLPLFHGVILLPEVVVESGKCLEGRKQDCHTFDAAGFVGFYCSGLNTSRCGVSASSSVVSQILL